MNAPDTGDARIARAIAQASCCIQVYKVAERPGAGRKFFLARSVVTQLRCHRQSQWHPQLSDACEPVSTAAKPTAASGAWTAAAFPCSWSRLLPGNDGRYQKA